jgi:hypothetical protein
MALTWRLRRELDEVGSELGRLSPQEQLEHLLLHGLIQPSADGDRVLE